MKHIGKILIGGMIVLSLGSVASAATFVSDEGATMAQPAADDVYILGQHVTIDQTVSGDVYAAGRSVRVSSDIAQDVHAIGQVVEVSQAKIGDDVLAAGNTVTISAAINGDLLVAGSDVTILPLTSIGHDVYAAGENITLNGLIKGNVYVSGNTVTVASGTVIEGNLISRGSKPPMLQEGAIVKGATRHILATVMEKQAETSNRLMGWVRHVLALFLGGWVLSFIFPTLIGSSIVLARQQTGRSFIVGLLWFIAFMPVAIILLMTVLGLSLGFLIISLSIAFFTMGSMAAAVLLGVWLSHAIHRGSDIGWPQILMGSVVYAGLQELPMVGWVIIFALFLISLGALLQRLWITLRPQTVATTVKP